MQGKTISTLTICMDEAGYILSMLRWLKQYVEPDEYVVVDGGSKDNTIELIEKFRSYENVKLRLIKNDMPESFSSQRNLALNLCTSEWVLHIDADEVYSKSMSSQIKLIKEGIPDDADLFGMVYPTAHLALDEFTMLANTGSDPHLRLFRNIPDVRYYGAVHEQPSSLLGQPIIGGVEGYPIKYDEHIALKHYSLLKNRAELMAKGIRYVKWIQHSRDAGIPLTDEMHFVNCVNSIKPEDIKPLPMEWY